MRVARTVDVRVHPAWERGLIARSSLPLRKRSAVETFNWHIRPSKLPVVGQVYPDGSCRDGPTQELKRCGWSFVIVDSDGHIAVAAFGVPPPWTNDIGGAEAWALYQ